MMEQNRYDATRWVVLAQVSVDGVEYTIDFGTRTFREMRRPNVTVRFDSEPGERLCRLAAVVTCPCCGVSALVPHPRPRLGWTGKSVCAACCSASVDGMAARR